MHYELEEISFIDLENVCQHYYRANLETSKILTGTFFFFWGGGSNMFVGDEEDYHINQQKKYSIPLCIQFTRGLKLQYSKPFCRTHKLLNWICSHANGNIFLFSVRI